MHYRVCEHGPSPHCPPETCGTLPEQTQIKCMVFTRVQGKKNSVGNYETNLKTKGKTVSTGSQREDRKQVHTQIHTTDEQKRTRPLWEPNLCLLNLLISRANKAALYWNKFKQWVWLTEVKNDWGKKRGGLWLELTPWWLLKLLEALRPKGRNIREQAFRHTQSQQVSKTSRLGR